VNHAIFMLAMLTSQYFEPRFNAYLKLLIYQISMLRSRIEQFKIVPITEERTQLLKLGAELNHQVDGLMFVVKPKSYRRWLSERNKGKVWKNVGRKRTPEAVLNLLKRMAEANETWGFRRIVGELKKLGIRIGETTARDALKQMDIYPDPTKGEGKKNLRWKKFLAANAESILATDFFSKPVWAPWEMKYDLYYLAFIHLKTRRAFCSYGTYHPDDEWVTQQCRNARMWAEEEGINVKFLIQDRDKKFSGKKFIGFWKGTDVKRIRTPIRAPMANAHIECWIGTLKKEVLNQIVGLNRRQINYVVHTWVKHFNTRRPHRGEGIGNTVLDVDFKPQTKGEIRCEQKLGGLITEWYRDEAA
jgi:putative transposase